MAKRDYYETMGVERNSSIEDIKKAYRKLAMQYHPDRNPGNKEAEEKFKEIGEAYAILSDENKRARYNRFGHQEPGMGGGSGFGFNGEGVDPFEIFRSFFGGFGFGGFGGDLFESVGGPRRRTANRGSDIAIDLTLTLEEIALGTDKKVKVKVLKACEACRGTGSKSNRQEVCPICKGSGESRQVTDSFFGRVVNITACNRCGGQGQVVSDPCSECSGSGVQRTEKTLSIHVPAGVSEGNYLKLREEGNSGTRGGPPGDIIVKFYEKSHSLFTRHDDDVLYELTISYPKAVLGDSLEIPTLDGAVRLPIPPGTPPGKLLRLRGKGITHLNGYGRGDLLVRINIHVPKKISAQERKSLEELDRLVSEDSSEAKSFFNKIKDAFG
ncbi:MAG: molecular chaperone DnaJ [Calditrichota bacterium]